MSPECMHAQVRMGTALLQCSPHWQTLCCSQHLAATGNGGLLQRQHLLQVSAINCHMPSTCL